MLRCVRFWRTAVARCQACSPPWAHQLQTAAFIAGTKGTLRLDSPFYVPGRITLTSLDRSVERTREFAIRTPAAALCYEAAEAARQITQGSTESPYLPLQESVAIIETLDRIREQIAPR